MGSMNFVYAKFGPAPAPHLPVRCGEARQRALATSQLSSHNYRTLVHKPTVLCNVDFSRCVSSLLHISMP